MSLYDLIKIMPFNNTLIYFIKNICFTYRYRILPFFRKNKDIITDKIYFISPEKIIYHTNYMNEGQSEETSIAHRVIPEKLRGKILEGDWDVSHYRFDSFYIYKSIKERIIDKKEWSETIFYDRHLDIVNNRHLYDNKVYWNIVGEETLMDRCNYIDGLISDIEENGYLLNLQKRTDLLYDEINVNIGRKGMYLFQDGRHRLSIAKLLKIDKIPVLVLARHKKWGEIRNYLYEYSKSIEREEFYTNLIHPDLEYIKYNSESDKIINVIKNEMQNKTLNVLDINPIIGYYCHCLEASGHNCFAYEMNIQLINIIKALKEYEDRDFTVIETVGKDDLLKLDPEVILYLFIKGDTDKEKILINAIQNCHNLNEIYLHHNNINDKKHVTKIIDQVLYYNKEHTIEKIYNENNNCVYKINIQ